MSATTTINIDQEALFHQSLSPSASPTEETLLLVGEELNHAQIVGFIVIACLSSSLSILGSARVWLLQKQSSNSSSRLRQQQSTTYHRLMASLSMADLLLSASCLIQPFLVNEERTVIPTAFGTAVTCQLSGFVLMWAQGACFMHNGMLSLYFWLVVVRGWTNKELQQWFERQAQMVAWIWPLVTPVVAVLGNDMEQGMVSMICITKVSPIPLLLHFFGMFLSITTSIVCTIWVYVVYRRRVSATLRRSSLNDFHLSNVSEAATAGSFHHQSSKRLQALARRSVAYTLVYLNTLLWPILVNILANNTDRDETNSNGEGLVYAIRVMTWIFFPLQGFFNLLIYAQPLVDRKQQQADDGTAPSKFVIFLQILVLGDRTNTGPPLSNTNSRRLNWSISSSIRAFFTEKETRGSNDDSRTEESPKHPKYQGG